MLKVQNLKKTYTVGDFVTKAVDDLSIEFRQTEFVAILGPSGCGKSTFLNILGALDRPDSGEISLYGNSLTEFKDIELDRYRNHSLGFIFQTHNLVQHLSIVENVEMGMTLSGVNEKERRERALELLNKVGLVEHMNKRPNQLSVGQSQRVAIARALANNPDIILADEPTGSVDSKTSRQIMELIKEVAENKLVIMVTHDVKLAEQYATRIVRLNDGRVESDSNPYDSSGKVDVSKELVLKKTAMSFKTSFLSALKNLKTKLGRAFLTAFASSIGIIGIALILALASGMNQEIETFQTQTIGQYPINISSVQINQDAIADLRQQTFESFPKEKEVIAYDSNIASKLLHYNNLTDEYVEYVTNYYNENPQLFSGFTVKPKMKYTIITPIVDAEGNTSYKHFFTDSSSNTMPTDQLSRRSTLLPDGGLFDSVYDILAGTKPLSDPTNKTFDIVLTVDKYNRINLNILNDLGFVVEDRERISFDEFVGKELLLKPGGYNAATFNPDDAIKLRISAIVRIKRADSFTLFNNGIAFTNELVDYIKENYPTTVSSVDYIHIYPINFDVKEQIKEHLDAYNNRFETEDDPNYIKYSDDSAVFAAISKTLIDSISIGLIAFTSISLVVSSIMIAIITYTSVIERTKEIGLIRALGARKKDVSRIFNSENIIIGLLAGILGMVLTYILTFPLNAILRHYAGVNDIAQVHWHHIVVMILISTFLAFVSGLIPARMAAQKDPVEALKIE